MEKSDRIRPRSSCFKKVLIGVLHKSAVKGLFKSKPRSPADLVRQTRSLLLFLDSGVNPVGSKRNEKTVELNKLLWELKSILYGTSECEPAAEACAQLTQEFFRENTLHLLIVFLPKLNLEARKDATQVVANLQRQPVKSRFIASDYLAANLDLMDLLVSGYNNPDIALHFGGMLRECIRHQCAARYILESEQHMKKFFDYIQLPNFDVAADVAATFKILGHMLLDRSNSGVMIRYVSSMDNMRILMNLLRLFVANQDKPADIVNILVANRSKLIRLFSAFTVDGEDEQFEADKVQVIREITELEAKI
ncbi:hypothetical protein LguiB_030231 [Lonicera macranthoides]